MIDKFKLLDAIRAFSNDEPAAAERLIRKLPEEQQGELMRLLLNEQSLEPTWDNQAISIMEIIKKPVERDALIDGVLEVERIFQLYGKPASLKTMIALDWCVAVASGKSWLVDENGENGLAVIQSPAIFVSQDQGHRDTIERLHAIFNSYGISNEIPLHTFVFPSPPLDLMRAIEPLYKAISDTGARLVILDNLFNIAGVAQENSSEIGLAIRNLAQLRDSTKSSICYLHHPNKADNWSRGHSVILQNVDQSIKVKREDPYITFEPEKERSAPILENVVARFDYEWYPDSRLMQWCQFRRVSAEEYQNKEMAELQPQIMAFVGEKPGVIRTEIYEHLGVRTDKAKDAVNGLLKTGQLLIGPGNGRGDHLYLPDDVPSRKDGQHSMQIELGKR